MAESISIQELESQIPNKNNNPFKRWLSSIRGEAKIVEPKREIVTSLNGIETSIEQTDFYRDVAEAARLDDNEIHALKENADLIRDKLNDSGGVLGAMKSMVSAAEEVQRAAEEIASNSGKVIPLSDRTDKVMRLLHDGRLSTETQKSKIESIIRLHKSTENHTARMKELRGELDEPLQNDLNLLFPVVQSEERVRALEIEMRDRLEIVLDIDEEKVSTESLKAIQVACLEHKNSAVSVVAELLAQQAILERYAKRRSERFPEKEIEISVIDYLEKKKLEMTPAIEMGVINIGDLIYRVTDLANALHVNRMIRLDVMNQLGIKGESLEKGSISEQYGEALMDYAKSIEAAKEAIRKSDKNPDSAMAAYLAMNRAILAGSNAIKLEKVIREVLAAASANEYALLTEKYHRAGDEESVLAGKIARLQNRGLKEKALFEAAMVAKSMINAINVFVHWADGKVDTLEENRVQHKEYLEEAEARSKVDGDNLADEILTKVPIK